MQTQAVFGYCMLAVIVLFAILWSAVITHRTKSVPHRILLMFLWSTGGVTVWYTLFLCMVWVSIRIGRVLYWLADGTLYPFLKLIS